MDLPREDVSRENTCSGGANLHNKGQVFPLQMADNRALHALEHLGLKQKSFNAPGYAHLDSRHKQGPPHRLPYLPTTQLPKDSPPCPAPYKQKFRDKRQSEKNQTFSRAACWALPARGPPHEAWHSSRRTVTSDNTRRCHRCPLDQTNPEEHTWCCPRRLLDQEEHRGHPVTQSLRRCERVPPVAVPVPGLPKDGPQSTLAASPKPDCYSSRGGPPQRA